MSWNFSSRMSITFVEKASRLRHIAYLQYILKSWMSRKPRFIESFCQIDHVHPPCFHILHTYLRVHSPHTHSIETHL